MHPCCVDQGYGAEGRAQSYGAMSILVDLSGVATIWYNHLSMMPLSFLQCFDTVGWATGRASGL